MTVAAIFLAFVGASGWQAMTGFGSALLAIPILALIVGPEKAVVGSVAPFLLLTGMTAISDRKGVQWKHVGLLLAAAVPGLPLGLLLLELLPSRVLLLVIAVVVAAMALLVGSGVRLPQRPPHITLVGFLAGVLETSTAISGPPLVAAFQALEFSPRQARGTLAAVFSCISLASALLFALAGQYTPATLSVSALGFPGVMVGWVVGDHIFGRTNAAAFRRLSIGTLLVAAPILFIRALLMPA